MHIINEYSIQGSAKIQIMVNSPSITYIQTNSPLPPRLQQAVIKVIGKQNEGNSGLETNCSLFPCEEGKAAGKGKRLVYKTGNPG